MKTYFKSVTIAGVLICAFAFAGCTSTGGNVQNQMQKGTNPQGQNLNYTMNSPNLPLVKPTPAPRITKSPNVRLVPATPVHPLQQSKLRADIIQRNLANLDGIQPVHVLVNGNTALVGYKLINVKEDAKTCKDIITNKVKQTDKSIKNVVVTNAPVSLTKMNQLISDIARNIPQNEYNTKFSQLMHSISQK